MTELGLSWLWVNYSILKNPFAISGLWLGHQHDVTCCDVIDGMLASGSADKLVRLWRYSAGKFIQSSNSPLSGHKYAVTSVKFSSDKKKIVSSSLDGSIIVWMVESGEIIHKFDHEESIAFRVVDWSVEGGLIAAGCDDNMMHIWNFESGTSVQCSWHENTVLAVSFSPNCQFVASGCSGEMEFLDQKIY